MRGTNKRLDERRAHRAMSMRCRQWREQRDAAAAQAAEARAAMTPAAVAAEEKAAELAQQSEQRYVVSMPRACCSLLLG